MKINARLYFKTIYYSFFKSHRTPGRLTPKRFFILCFIFIFYPFWHFSIRFAYFLDNLFYPEYQHQEVKQPIFIVGNFRSGTTLLHRLLAMDNQFTCLQSWEIYVAPSIVQRHIIGLLIRLNKLLGNPAQKIIRGVEKALSKYSYMHPTGVNQVEEDSQVLFHIWSTYNLLAFFPFPELVRNYIYYDDEIPQVTQSRDMGYYQEVIKRHLYSHQGKRYVSKNPTYSPKVKALHNRFPDAKFVNIVRNPLRVVPSTISMFENHWKTYGKPEKEYSLKDILIEHSRHWYLYPHQYLKNLPPEQYIMIRYRDLIRNPRDTIERIYNQFGLEITGDYSRSLEQEALKAKQFKSSHRYSLKKMGLNKRRLSRQFESARKLYGLKFNE
ncbi:sulfotransferase [bacterium]|nr:sulfotransferase [bacterium]